MELLLVVLLLLLIQLGFDMLPCLRSCSSRSVGWINVSTSSCSSGSSWLVHNYDENWKSFRHLYRCWLCLPIGLVVMDWFHILNRTDVRCRRSPWKNGKIWTFPCMKDRHWHEGFWICSLLCLLISSWEQADCYRIRRWNKRYSLKHSIDFVAFLFGKSYS